MEQGLGFAHFRTHADGVGETVLGALLLFSVASWYLIVTRALTNTFAQRRVETFLKRFWQAGSLAEVRLALSPQQADNAFARLVQRAAEAAEEGERQGAQSLAVAGGMAEYLTRVLHKKIDQESVRVEYGLTVLASAGSAAPYIATGLTFIPNLRYARFGIDQLCLDVSIGVSIGVVSFGVSFGVGLEVLL